MPTPINPQIIFVSDDFSDTLLGGAELTSEALIKTCPVEIQRLRAEVVTPETVLEHRSDIWIFGNFTKMPSRNIQTVINNLRYFVVEFDFKFCQFRSPEYHRHLTKTDCKCQDSTLGKLVAEFYRRSQKIFWMSERQHRIYYQRFHGLGDNAVILGSVFDLATIERIETLRKNPGTRRGWVILKSESWVKGHEAALRYCATNKIKPMILDKTSYDKTLEILSKAQGLIYLPQGSDTCPRLVIEAKLLGCELVINDNVLHKDEDWFQDEDSITHYLLTRAGYFWSNVMEAYV